MKYEKYVISDILNYYYLDNCEKKSNLKKEISFHKILRNFDKDFLNINKEILEKHWDYTHSNIVYIVTHPIIVQKYESSEYVTLVEQTIFRISKQGSYDKDTGLMLIETDKDNLYVASADEVEYFSIPVLCYKENSFFLPFKLMKYKTSMWSNKLDTVFHTLDLDINYMWDYIPLIAILKEFILMQNEEVYIYFLSNILNILTDAKNMLNSDFNLNEKKELLNETIKVLNKLRNSINDVSSYNYDNIHSVEYYIQQYYKKEEEKQKELEKEEEKRLREKEKLKKERSKRKNQYLETIKIKSELLDYFNFPTHDIKNLP